MPPPHDEERHSLFCIEKGMPPLHIEERDSLFSLEKKSASSTYGDESTLSLSLSLSLLYQEEVCLLYVEKRDTLSYV